MNPMYSNSASNVTRWTQAMIFPQCGIVHNAARCGAILEADSPAEHLRPHHPVAGKTVERMFEGGRAVVFEKEMTHPGEPIAEHRQRQQPCPVLRADGGQRNQEHERAADEM